MKKVFTTLTLNQWAATRDKLWTN